MTSQGSEFQQLTQRTKNH